MKLFRHKDGCYSMMGIGVEDLAVISTAVNLFSDEIGQKGQMPHCEQACRRVKTAFLKENVIED